MPSCELTDGEIIERVREGEIRHFSALVDRYQGPLLALAISRLGKRDLAEDAVQEAFLCAFRWLDSYDSRFAFRTWLWTILLNQCSRAAEKERRAERIRTGFANSSPPINENETLSPAVQLELKEDKSQLRSALNQLPQSHADAIRLRFFGELKFDAIAEATGCSLRTAKYRVKEGLKRLGDLLLQRRAESLSDKPAPEQSGHHLEEEKHALR
jgi:RNA polymerase sigma-70 factor, ECF subfamily